MTHEPQPVLIAGAWRPARSVGTYRACEPATGRARDAVWPVSGWEDLDEALDAATAAAAALRTLPAAAVAAFLERYAERLAARGDELVAAAHAET